MMTDNILKKRAIEKVIEVSEFRHRKKELFFKRHYVAEISETNFDKSLT